MSQEPEHPEKDSPQFKPSPKSDQPGTPPPAEAASSATKTKPASRPRGSTTSLWSNTILMILGAALAAGGYALSRVYAPPRAPGEMTNQPPADAVKPDDFKKLTDRVEKMSSELDQAKEQIKDRPDYGPELKMQRERVTEINRTITDLPARFDSINQKLDTLGKVETTISPSRIDAIDKRIGDLANAVDSLRTNVVGMRKPTNSSGSPTILEDVNLEGMAMEQAVSLFKARKYTEARDAFKKLQTVFPNDARVWYYSALANGFASGEWLGETERLVNQGLDKEKAGQPSTDKVDAVFADLTKTTGKEWLADYRKRIGAR